MKIAIIGYSGAGKSTLAKIIAERYNIPLLYLDIVQFEPNWKERDRETARGLVRKFLENDSWVIDGNYRQFYQKERLEQADIILFLNYRRAICFRQAFRRHRTFKGKTRESAANGCNEQFDFEFMKWILFDGRSKHYRDHYQQIIQDYSDKVVVLHNSKETEEYLRKLNNQ